MAARASESRLESGDDRITDGVARLSKVSFRVLRGFRGGLAVVVGWLASNTFAMEITQDTQLDPDKVYGSLVIKSSNITIDGRGAWIVGEKDQPGNKLKGVAILAEGVSNVTLKNVNAKGWETGLRIVGGSGWKIENCNFSDNFHDPEFGWGENGRRGGIVLEGVTKSTLRKNKANRVWDACVLVNSDENVLEENDFSHTSNTCLKLWTACRNTIRKNVLSHGIRIKPGEVHARDSTSVLIESGSNENRLIENDCTHGGDGIFVRVLNGWCSTGNLFENNDCSFANNNGVECWAPRNVFLKNKANHCSYGFWLGGSDQSRLIGNEASFNGLKNGHHNSPHLPQDGHAGIVFMFGPSSHTVCRGNICRENNGAGIALIGDLDSQGKKWRAYHWIIEQNTLGENRWGIYAKHADWVTLAGNRFDGNSVKDVQLDGGVTRWEENSQAIAETVQPPLAKLTGPMSVKLGERAQWDASSSRDPNSRELKLTWDVGNGRFLVGPKLEHTFDRVGFHRVGLNASNGWRTEMSWRDVYVVRDVTEIGTEGAAANWSIEDFHDRTRSNEQVSRVKFADDTTDKLVGKSALSVVIAPYAGFRAALTFPKTRDANWPLAGKTKLVFWLKATNEDVTGWQGGPFIRLDGEAGQQCHIEPNPGLDHMRNAEHNEARDGWRLFEIPLRGNDQWQTDGEIPAKIRALALAFDSWGAPTLRFTIDGLAFE